MTKLEEILMAGVLDQLRQAVQAATEKHEPHVDWNHTIGILIEELDELKDELRAKPPNQERILAEATQIAVAAIRGVWSELMREAKNTIGDNHGKETTSQR